MESNFAAKGDELMKKAEKKLKGNIYTSPTYLISFYRRNYHQSYYY